MVLQHLARRSVLLNMEDFDTLEHSIDRIRFMLQMFALGEMPDHEQHQVEILDKMLLDLETRASFTPAVIAVTYTDVPGKPEETVDELLPDLGELIADTAIHMPAASDAPAEIEVP